MRVVKAVVAVAVALACVGQSDADTFPPKHGQWVGPLSFDPLGADFTGWLERFNSEVYKNWTMPQVALDGMKGKLDVEFTVERDGSLSRGRVVVSSGAGALDDAALTALTKSHFPPLPSDYGPKSLNIRVTFCYNDGPTKGNGPSVRDSAEPKTGNKPAPSPPESVNATTLPGKPAEARLALPSIASSLRNIDQLRQTIEPPSVEWGNPMFPLLFDPMGADFAAWLQQFKTEVYKNWLMPQPAVDGVRGHVDVEFTVERAGHLSHRRVRMSSGNPSLDKAATNALESSQFLALPADYAPPSITMRASFFYNEEPAKGPGFPLSSIARGVEREGGDKTTQPPAQAADTTLAKRAADNLQASLLVFDPAGADFTAWLRQFQTEIFRNWIMAKGLQGGMGGGPVEMELTVERDGSLSQCRIPVPSDNAKFDEALTKALKASQLSPLPPDYGPKSLSMRVRFSYTESPTAPGK